MTRVGPRWDTGVVSELEAFLVGAGIGLAAVITYYTYIYVQERTHRARRNP